MTVVRNKKNLPVYQWLGLSWISLLLFFLPYQAGLYNANVISYEDPLYQAMLLTFSLACLSIVFLYSRWSINNYKAILSLSSLLLPICYYVSTFYGASKHGSQFVFLMIAMCVSFFLLALYFADRELAQKILAGALGASVYAIVIFGLLNMFGQVFSKDALWFTQGEYRLTSVFQYSNTYAGFLSAAFMICLYWVISSRKWYWVLIHSLMLIPITVSFLLTFSRGGLVLIPFMVLIYLIFLRFRAQVLSILAMLFTASLTLVVIGKITTYYKQIAAIVQPQDQKPVDTISMFSTLPLKGWSLLIGASLFNFILIYAVQHWLMPWIEKRSPNFTQKSSWWIPAATIVVGGLLALLVSTSNSITKLLPSDLADRIESINLHQHSVLERGTFYSDAWKIVKDHPFGGVGGNGWTALYEKYQNNPYTSTQVHSYPLQTLVEVGWIGFLLFVAFLAFAYFLYIRSYFQTKDAFSGHFVFFIFSVSLLIHSFIDFDMSFGYIGILFFVCLGGMLAPFTAQLNIDKWETYNLAKTRHLFPVVISIISLILFIWSARGYMANNNYNKAIDMATSRQGTLDEVMAPLDKALKLSSSNPTFIYRKIDWLSQGYAQTQDKNYLAQINDLFSQAEKDEPYDKKLINAKIEYYKSLNDTPNELKALDEAIQKFQWDIDFYQNAIVQNAIAGQSERTLELFNEVLHKIDHLKTLPKEQMQGRPFDVTPAIRQAVGAVYYSKADYKAAEALLEPLKQGDLNDPATRTGIRYYLASLHALGQKDDALQAALIGADPNEQAQIDALDQQAKNS
ncbi:O-antigen ligase family protein [Cohnella candidum]|uniref:O-antigen ligase-related domain-containing protein n=1 Tax=Cohnella candidum TaxID=2674991 RepID=A0A3G3K0V6_9BACL|nr:O-antigen ligase family protein [Cohnella candidum]AYQ74174.1 hypothetical protein EAV92_17350 [Cohnella candidum]